MKKRCIFCVCVYFQGEFTDDGTETHFTIEGHAAYLRTVSSGKRREGMIHSLVVDGREIPEARGDEI